MAIDYFSRLRLKLNRLSNVAPPYYIGYAVYIRWQFDRLMKVIAIPAM